MSRTATKDELGWAWVSHLHEGGTTPWKVFSAAPQPARSDARGTVAWFPGAQQLELLRRLNLAGRPSPDLVTQVLTADLPMRGPLDLDLLGVGRNGVDPEQVPQRELVRVAVGILARRAVRLGVPAPKRTRRRTRRARRVWRAVRSRPVRLVGDPMLVRGSRRQLTPRGRRPLRWARRHRPVLVVGTGIDRMLFDAWWHRVLRHGAPGWEQWQRGVVARDRLPASVDLAAIAGRWRERSGDVRVALNPAAVDRVTGARQLRMPGIPDPAVAELTRLIGAVVGVEVEPEERTRLLRRRVWPDLARAARALPTVGHAAQSQPAPRHRLLPQVHDWAREQQAGLLQRLQRCGYPVLGEAAPIAPAQADGAQSGQPAALVRLVVAALLEDGASPRSPAPGGAA